MNNTNIGMHANKIYYSIKKNLSSLTKFVFDIVSVFVSIFDLFRYEHKLSALMEIL